ncbi:hypothetical protein STPL106120_10225 [Streptococcus pluranimalium]|uniref:SEC10/PgrA surface exclusion domain-containing protein n=1 Tax=Streptococcus pluranimalium TaxID=82348 RepID=UPI0039EBB9EA
MNTQAKVVEEAKTATAKEQADVDAAQKDVDAAQAALDGTGAQAVYDAQTLAQETVNQDKKNVADAQTKLDAAKKADSDRQTAIDNAQTDANDKSSALVNQTNELKSASETDAKTQATLLEKQADFIEAENNYKAINTIVLSDDYVKYMTAAYDYSTGFDDAASAARNEANKKLLSLGDSLKKLNTFKSNPNDVNREIDITNLSDADKFELAFFAADLSNQVRNQMGTDPVDVTSSSIAMGWYQADYYSGKFSTMWDMKHDTSAVESVFGLSWVDENLAGQWTKALNMDQAKEAIYESYKNWLFANDESLHASSISGHRNTMDGTLNHIGIGISVYPDGSAIVNYNNMNEGGYSSKTSNSTFDTTPLKNPIDSASITKSYMEALQARDEAQKQANASKTKLDSVQKAYNQAVEDDKLAKEKLANTQAVAIQTPAAQSELTRLQAILESSQKALAQANANVAKLEADVTVKKENLDKAKAELAIQQSELELAQENQSKEESELADKQKALFQANNSLAEAKQALFEVQANKDRLVNAQANLEAAQKAYDEAVAGKNVADQKLEAAKAKLEASKDAYDEAKAVYDKEKAIYDAMVLAKAKADEAARLAALQAKKDQLIADGKTPVAVYDNGVIVDYVAERPRPILTPNGQTSTDTGTVIQTAINQKITRDETQKVLTRRQSQETYEAKLPNTGEASSATYMLIGASLIALAAGTRKRRQG